MSSRIPEPESEFEAQGIPDQTGTPYPKVASGDYTEGMIVPQDDDEERTEAGYRAATAYGTTGVEERAGETIDHRLAQEEPDVLTDEAAATVPAGDDELANPFSTPGGTDVGRLVEYDEGARADTEPDAVARSVGTDRGGFSAEEAAMHLEPEA